MAASLRCGEKSNPCAGKAAWVPTQHAQPAAAIASTIRPSSPAFPLGAGTSRQRAAHPRTAVGAFRPSRGRARQSTFTLGTGPKPGGTAATQRTITATITAIDPSAPSITFKGPNDWTYSSRVQDRDVLKKVKVGDRVDITWTEALLISVE